MGEGEGSVGDLEGNEEFGVEASGGVLFAGDAVSW